MYKILIVKDEIGTARPVKEALELYGYEADIASDGEIGLEMFENNKYDLILLDLKMPKMTGEELLRKIRQKNPYIYVLIYTNYTEFESIKALVNIGIDGYIDKESDDVLKELISIIKNRLDPILEIPVKELWLEFGEVPMNPKTECIESEWNGFPAGTHREDIWHWFEETFDVSVAEDLMRL